MADLKLPTAQEFLSWIGGHDYFWYHPPMDVHPSRVWVRSKVRRWKSNQDRFEVTVERPGVLKFRIDNGHLDRIRIPVSAQPNPKQALSSQWKPCQVRRLSNGKVQIKVR